MLDSLIFQFLWKLFTGELWHIWRDHENRLKEQAIADSPDNPDELADDFKHHRV